ncbi:MAG: 4Fe-4S dicluster domain-containing protein [Proteobacteria bacterium]|nr:4Fe-4S dicluster domain-containing protein [Pseudomonadota bacterium]
MRNSKKGLADGMVGGGIPAAGRTDLNETDRGLAGEVAERSGTEPRRCYACLTCSGGCPFYRAMDYGPHGIMRRVNMGLREEVLASNTIWLCVGCHTCSSVCPMAIDVAAVMDVLRVMALEQGTPVAEPDVLEFHREVLRSIEKYGRTHKLEIMLRLKLHSGSWLQDADLGLKMLAKRKLDLRPSRVRAVHELEKIFKPAWRRSS